MPNIAAPHYLNTPCRDVKVVLHLAACDGRAGRRRLLARLFRPRQPIGGRTSLRAGVKACGVRKNVKGIYRQRRRFASGELSLLVAYCRRRALARAV